MKYYIGLAISMKETTAITEEGKFEWPPKNAHYKQRECTSNQMSVRFITFECTVTILETAHDRITEIT